MALSADAQQARLEAQQLRIDKQTILASYNAVKASLDEKQASLTINPTTAAIVGVGALFGLLIFVMWKWSGRVSDPPAPPVEPLIESDYIITDDPQPEEQI